MSFKTAIRRGVELGSASITGSSTPTTSSTPVVVPGLSVPVIVKDRPVRVVFDGTFGQNGTTSYTAHAALFEDGVQIAQKDITVSATQFTSIPLTLAGRSTPSPGAHTYDVRIWVPASTTGGVYISASATMKALLEVLEI